MPSNLLWNFRDPFSFTLRDLDLWIWCGPELAAMLRLAFENSEIEHPTKEGLSVIRDNPQRVFTERQAEILKAELTKNV